MVDAAHQGSGSRDCVAQEQALLAAPDASVTARLRGLERVLAVADTLVFAPPLALGAVAARSGLSHAACHRWLQAMVQARLAVREGGLYQLGPRWMQWAARVASTDPVRPVARAPLAGLARTLGLRTVLARRWDTCWVTLEIAGPGSDAMDEFAFGQTGPLFAGACGRVLLAWLEGWERQTVWGRMGWAALTPRTPSRHRLARDLERVRAQGWAVTAGERRVGGFSVAVPVVRPSADGAGVQHAVAIGGVGIAWRPSTLPAWVSQLLAIGENLSRAVGYRGPYPPP